MVQSPQFRVLRCPACGRLDGGPREICPSCFAADPEPADVDGVGALVSWTIIRRPPTRFRQHGAYCIAVVDLDAGVRLTARLEGAAETLEPGARVVLVGQEDDVAIFRCDAPACAAGM